MEVNDVRLPTELPEPAKRGARKARGSDLEIELGFVRKVPAELARVLPWLGTQGKDV